MGAHLRHALEHFQCFLRGLPEGVVDFDGRDRNRRLEESPEEALRVLQEVSEALERLDATTSADLALMLRVLPSRHGEPVTVSTTLRRELLFLASHTIHHLALIRVVARLAGSKASPEVGVAFSTARYREAERLAGR